LRLFACIRAYALLIALCSATACEKLPSYRYRLTVVVRTPQGVRTGSAVREVDAHTEPHFLPEAGGGYNDLRGEAVAIDLPGGKSLFAILDAPTPEARATQVALHAFREHFRSWSEPYREMAQFLSQTKLKTALPRSAFPDFVIFHDPTNPATVSFVDRDHPERTLGEGSRVESIIIETTHDPVISLIETRLPWLRALKTTLGGKPFKNYDSSAANILARDDFIQP
jgi:hypothetical protein